MGGFFGAVTRDECIADVFYGTDYHSHLGNKRGGLLFLNDDGLFQREIHDITHDQFRSKFEGDLDGLHGRMGIGCISDTDSQPLICSSRCGKFGITMVGVVNNLLPLRDEMLEREPHLHFSEMFNGVVSPTEIAATLISGGNDIAEGLRDMQDRIDGSCSVLLLSKDGVYACRDVVGRTPIVIGRKEDGSLAAAFESCALHNLGYKVVRWLGPGEAVLLEHATFEIRQVLPPRSKMRMCAFMWIYYGFPASSYEGINVEESRYRCGAELAKMDDTEVDAVAGVPDSGTAHALGYASERGIPFRRSFIKYTPTWPRSFISDSQTTRRHVAKMKLIPIQEFIRGQRLLFCEDSIVRGTQLKDTFARLPEMGAKEIHVRSACPPILYGCRFLNFSPSRGPLELIARRAIHKLEDGKETDELITREYSDCRTERHRRMVEEISREMGFTTLKFQTLDRMLKAIGFPTDRLCTYCWTGRD